MKTNFSKFAWYKKLLDILPNLRMLRGKLILNVSSIETFVISKIETKLIILFILNELFNLA